MARRMSGSGGKLTRQFAIDLTGTSALPAAWRAAATTGLALVQSIASCALVAWLAQLLRPQLFGYGHFRFGDYAKLTALGVAAASVAWLISAVLWSHARPPFLVGAAAVTAVSFAPDVWIWAHGQPPSAVISLALVHVTVAAITSAALVVLVPQRRSHHVPVSDATTSKGPHG